MRSAPPQKKSPHPDVLRGLEAQRQGQSAKAETLYRQVLARDAKNFDAHSLLGVLLAQGGRPRDGLASLEAAAALRPGSANVQRNIGIVRLQLNDAAGALTAFTSALRAAPDDIDSLRGQVRSLGLLKRLPEAEACLRKIVALRPQSAADLTDLGAVLAEQEKYRDGIEVLARAARLNPASAAVHTQAARCFSGLHEFEKARTALERARSLDPKQIAIQMALAEVHRAQNQSEAALDLVDACLAAAPDNTSCKALKASLLLDQGRRAEASTLYRELAGIPRHQANALLELAQSKTLTAEDPDATLILATNPDEVPAGDRAILGFARGKCLEDLAQYDAAFEAYSEARRLRAAALGVAPTGPDVMIRAFEKSLFDGTPVAGNASERPVFIVGMPRSGTSLVEQIIGAHPEAAGAGELYEMMRIGQEQGLLQGDPTAIRGTFLRIGDETGSKLAERYLGVLRRSDPNAVRIADKMPHNFMMLGLIARLFPKARIVHVKREAADTCFSCFANNLSDYHRYANDLAALGRYYAAYHRLMRHWKNVLPLAMHDIEYETLVEAPEQEAKKLIAFLGLEWNERCLRFFESGGTVSTFSRGQVRQPIYNRSIGRWKKFENHLAPLFEALGELAPMPRSVSSGPSSAS